MLTAAGFAKLGAYGKAPGIGSGAVAVMNIDRRLSLVTVLDAFDWVFQNRLKHDIRAIAHSWGTSVEVSPDDPISVATRVAHDAGVAVIFAARDGGSSSLPKNRYCAARGAICASAGRL